MKKVLIIYPHFPPSNLAGVHRPRLFAQHLSAFGWEPVIVTVDEKYYEENLDWNLKKLLPNDLRVEKVKALKVTKPRIIGDIGLRSFFQLYRKAKEILLKEKIDFLLIPVPSFYTALIGRWLHTSTGTRYGIDYIDPWVHTFPGSKKVFSRHWISTRLSKLLEPLAVKKASLITGVAEGYYQGVIERNPQLTAHCVFGAMPYGGEAKDHESVKGINVPYLFPPTSARMRLVYAGAMLPKAYEPLELIFTSIKNNPTVFDNIQFHFIGTGKTPDDATGFNIKLLAEKYGLWQTTVYEYPKRIPYLDVLAHLSIADGIFILGSTESHYTPSKTYQGVLSGKPLLAVLHKESSAVAVIRDSRCGVVLDFNGEDGVDKIEREFSTVFIAYKNFLEAFTMQQVDMEFFESYSARSVTQRLAKLLDQAIAIDTINES